MSYEVMLTSLIHLMPGYLDLLHYELQKQNYDNVEIASFGLAPKFIGKGLGGYLLFQAIKSAWEWKDTRRVWVHTCNLDHPNSLPNYKARGMKVYNVETANKGAIACTG